MQVMNGGDIKIDKKQVWNIGYNIDKGIEILQEHLRLSGGNVTNALKGYSGYLNKQKQEK